MKKTTDTTTAAIVTPAITISTTAIK